MANEVFDPPGVQTVVPLLPGHGAAIVAYLQQHGVTVYGAGANGDDSATVVLADRDVTALLAAYAPPAEPVRARDRIEAAVQGRNYGEALSRLLAAISLADD